MIELPVGNLPPTTVDFLPQYKAIGQSLKKRFFRRPNVAEAIEQYESLGQELQREEQKTFAAICYLEAAKCQENLKNYVPQANSLVKAGKLFLDSWEGEKHFNNENSDKSETNYLMGSLEMGTSILSQAAKSFGSQGYKGSAMLLNLRVGDILYTDGSYGEALNYYKTALLDAKQNFSFIDQLKVTELVCKTKVKMTEYESVLKTVNDALIAIKNHQSELDIQSKVLASFAQRFEMIKVMLVLILGANTTDISDFIWPKVPTSSGMRGEDDFSSPSPIPGESYNPYDHQIQERVEVTYLLKSLVLAVQEGSNQELRHVHNKLIPFMNETHHDLMKYLIQIQC